MNVDELREQLAQHCSATCNRITARLDRLESGMFGNGKEGLMERISRIEQNFANARWVIGLAAGAFLTGLINIALVFIRG